MKYRGSGHSRSKTCQRHCTRLAPSTKEVLLPQFEQWDGRSLAHKVAINTLVAELMGDSVERLLVPLWQELRCCLDLIVVCATAM